MRWLEDNPLGKVLAGISAGLAVVLLLLALAWSLPPRGAVEEDEDGRDLAVTVPELPAPAPIDRFAVITDRPVFNESRLPEEFADADEEGDDDEGAALADTDVEAPDVTLSGVVITPSLRMATLRPRGEAESLIALEGSPLEGDYGSWHVSAIEPRRVVLRSGGGEEVRLDLQVHDEVIAEPPKPPPSRPAAQDGGDAESDEPMSRAEEIRQRIAERREELRRAAEENEQAPPRRPGYNNAIQQLIQGKRTESEDENEQ